MREPPKQILRDLSPGFGGLRGALFDTKGTDTLAYDYTSNILGTENDVAIVTELDTPVAIS